MSYDLHFRSVAGEIDEEAVLDYFRARPRYSVENRQMIYENADTGAVFIFELEEAGEEATPEVPFDDNQRGIVMNVNYAQPDSVVLEAETEAKAFAEHFGLKVHDPQAEVNGIGKDEGQLWSGGLTSSYNTSDRKAHSALGWLIRKIGKK